MAGAIPGYVVLERGDGGPLGGGDEELGSEPIPAFSIFEGETPVCLDCTALVPGGGVELVSMMDDFQARWEEEYRNYGGGEGIRRELGRLPDTHSRLLVGPGAAIWRGLGVVS